MGIEPYRPAAAAAVLLRYSRPDGLDDGGLRPPDKVFRKQRLEMLKMWVTLDKAFGYMINQNLNSQEE